MKLFSVKKGYCKQLYELNQIFKNVFPQYVTYCGIMFDARDESMNSLNYVDITSPLIELGITDDVIIDSAKVYAHLTKGRQKVTSIGIDDGILYFIKEDEILEFGKVMYTMLPHIKDRFEKISYDIKYMSGSIMSELPDSIFCELLDGGKFASIPCGKSELIVGKRLFEGLKDTHSIYYSYSDIFETSSESSIISEKRFIALVNIDRGDIETHHFFEASVF